MSKIYRRKKIKNFILFIVVILAFFLFLYLSLYFLKQGIKKLKFFNISKISIVADEHIDKDKVLKNSGIELEENIFSINIDEAVKQILKDSWIKSVKIKKVYPKNLLIEAKIKEICGIGKQNQKLIFIDCFGKLIDKFKPELNKEFIIFESYNNDYIPILELLQRLAQINNGEIFNLQNISEIYLADTYYYIVKLQNRNESIHLTLNKNLEQKLIDVNKVLKDLDRRNERGVKIDATLPTNKIVVKTFIKQ